MPVVAKTENRRSSQEQRAPHIPALTSLRFLLAMVVVLIHYKRQVSNLGMEVPIEHLSNVVTGFFVLSGFLLTYQYSSNGWKTPILAFWKTRFARLMPTYWFFIGVALATLPLGFFFPDKSTWPLIITSNVLLVQALFTAPSVYFGLIPPAYSLASEAIFYAVFPLIMLSIRKWRWWLAGAVLAVIVLPIAASISRNHEWIVYVFGPCPWARFIEFYSGILLAKLFFRFKNHQLNIRLTPLLESIAYSAFLYFVCQPFTGTFLAAKPLLFGIEHAIPLGVFILNRAIAIAGYGTLVWVLACRRGLATKVLSGTTMVFLGESSYALFLVHDLLVRFVLVHKESLAVVPADLLFAIYLAAALGLSCAAFVLIERPWRKWLLSSFFEVGTLKVDLLKRLLGPVAGTVLLAATILGGAYCVDPLCFRLIEAETTSIPESVNVGFADSLTLKAVHVRDSKPTAGIYLKFRSQANAAAARYLSVSTLDANGKELWSSSVALAPPSGIWYQTFVLPTESLRGARDLAIAVSNKEMAMLVSSGRRDWSFRRLLVSLPEPRSK